MAQYRTGTVTLTNGDATVTGVGTSWLSNLSVGDIFIRIGDSVPYFVGSITNDTSLELTAPYVGVTGSGVSYAVTTDFTPNSALGLLSPTDLETAITFNANMTAIDEALADRPALLEGIVSKNSGDMGSFVSGLVFGTDGAVSANCNWTRAGRAITCRAEINCKHFAKGITVGDRFWIDGFLPLATYNPCTGDSAPLGKVGSLTAYALWGNATPGSQVIATFDIYVQHTTSTVYFLCTYSNGSLNYGNAMTGTFTYFIE